MKKNNYFFCGPRSPATPDDGWVEEGKRDSKEGKRDSKEGNVIEFHGNLHLAELSKR